MKSQLCWTALLAVMLSSPLATAAEPIGPQQFDKLHQLIKPHKAERNWERIPWMTDLWEARKKAAAEGKPILLWEMDGHPLGCV